MAQSAAAEAPARNPQAVESVIGALAARFDAEARRAVQATGGDDYELCFTVPTASIGAMHAALAAVGGHATRIGAIVEGQGVRAIGGAPLAATRGGWDHFGP